MEKKEIKCRIMGKVIMVMFRDFVQRKARGLGIVGTVENKDDRSVEVLAQGTEDDLESLIEHLNKGPFFARVLHIDVDWREPTGEYDGFKIIY